MYLLRVGVAAALLTTVVAQSSSTADVVTLSGSATGSATGNATGTTTGSAAATTTAADYATGSELTYNTNYSPSSLATTFTYVSGSETVTRSGTTTQAANATVSGNSAILLSSTGNGATVLTGAPRTTSAINGTAASSTSSSARPTNTQPCNGYPELCNRRYSNITHVAAHNSPFIAANNVASNQALDVTTQLNDGVRMLQFQVHKPNATSDLMLCHTSCDLQNAGTLVNYLSTVKTWLDDNRYDVVTILMGNYDVLSPENFTGPVADSGLLDYAFIPDTVPMALDGWPTLAEMILTNKRAVIMLDYEANQAEIPWLLDEFSYVWETPFSPTDREFPCTVDRPPAQDRNISAQRMSLANHNLNIDITFASFNILVPAYNLLNVTNGVTGYGSAGAAVSNCTALWDRPPNFLLVDYYNIGSFNGSALAVAATANNVTYNSASCCGTDSTTSLGLRLGRESALTMLAAAFVAFVLML